MSASAGFFLSPQQKYIWSRGASPRSQIAILIEGSIDAARLRQALHAVVQANDALRTTFQRQTGMKMPFQMVLDSLDPVWGEENLEPSTAKGMDVARKMMAREAGAVMPPDASPLRSSLARLDEERTIWVLTAHAAVADSASMPLIVRETLKSYTGASVVVEDALRYVQFAQWQSDLLTSDDDAAKDGNKFWEKMTQGSATPELPGEVVATEASNVAVSALPVELRGNLQAAVSALGGDVSENHVILSAWSAVMARWTGLARVEIGIVLEGREYEELASLIGAVSKFVPMGVSIAAQRPFRELVSQVSEQYSEAASLQEYYAPEKTFKAGFEFVTLQEELLEGAKFVPLMLVDQAFEAPLKLNVRRVLGVFQMELQFRPDTIAEWIAREIAVSLEAFLEAALADSSRAVGNLPIVSSVRRKQFLSEWNSAPAPYPPSSIQSLITGPSMSIAVRSGDEILSYGDLELSSNRLAHYLLKQGVRVGSLVGLCVGRSAQMMVPVLAILKAGGAYVPLSADQPKVRTAQQLEGIEVLVTEAALLEHLPAFRGRTVVLDASERPWTSEPEARPEVEVSGDDLAYVIYTSGSTGTPKGVGVRHRNLVNYATHIVRALELEAAPLQYATVSTLSADLGNTVIYPSLLTGGTLHVLPYEVATDPKQMAEYQSQYAIDVLKIVPSHLTALLEGAGGAVLPNKYLITGGEALKPALVERIRSASTCEVINHYGPTETTVGSLMLRLEGTLPATATVPIGQPIANTRVYVLDGNRELVPVGVAGELYISGAGVTAGYIGQAALTAERFLADPFAPDAVMYKTGDLVRWLPEGMIEFLGRADDQVKIRGYRVELGEIETLLASLPGVRQSTVIARGKDADPDDKQVIAYVVLDRQQATTTEALKQSLKQSLPDYMVPTAIVELAKLPLTPNGKIDRKALPAPEERSARVYKPPTTATEQMVAQIWADVLKLDKISTDDNFFDLGGHSLLATQVISRIREGAKVEIPLRTMFEKPVLAEFALVVDEVTSSGGGRMASAPIKRAVRQAYRPAGSDDGSK